MTRVTQLIHDAGKYLLISVYPLPTHPTHNFTHTNGGNLETLPGWPKKLQHNRPALPSHYQNWLQIIDIHPRAISQNMSKIWWQLLASPVLLGSQWVNPCLPSPMHDWAAEAAKHDPASSLKTVNHQSALRNIMFRSREWSTCLLNWEKNIWLFIWHISEHCQIDWSILLFIFISELIFD